MLYPINLEIKDMAHNVTTWIFEENKKNLEYINPFFKNADLA